MKTIIKNTLLSVISIFLSLSPLLAQNTGIVSGTVKSEKTGEILFGANVYLKGTHIGSSTDENGIYSITKVPSGKWTLVCSVLSYLKSEKEITVESGQSIKVDFSLREDALNFSEVVVTATRTEELATTIPVATEVLDTKDIHASNAKDVGEALRSVGASLIKSYGTVGSLESVSLRGSTDSQVLILVDGQKLNNAQQGSVDLSSIPLDAIERVEVVKGGNSAMYGSDAVGGVINIITKAPARKSSIDYSVKGLFGTYGTKVYNASLGQGINGFDYFLSYNRTQSTGNYDYTDLTGKSVEMKNADTKADNIFFKGGYLFDDHSRFSAFYKYRKSDNGSPGSIDYPNFSARTKTENNHVSLSYEGLCFGPLAFNFNTYFMRQDYRYINPEAWGGKEESIYKTTGTGLIMQGFIDLTNLGLISYGYEFREDKLESDNLKSGLSQPFIGNHTRNVNSIYLQDDWKYDIDPSWKISVVPALRLDKYPEESIGSQVSPKVGISFSHNDLWIGSLRGNYGKVFRAPTYNDLYWPEDSWTKGNPDLKPEKGTTYDAGFIIQFPALESSWSLEATYFGSNLDDLILWASDGGKWLPKNVAKASVNGIETKLAWKGIDNILGLQTSYTYMEAKDKGDNPLTKDKFLIYRPKDKFDLILNLNYSFASFNFYYNYVGKRFHDESNKVEMGDYSLLSANVGVSPKLFGVVCDLKLEMNNITDKEIQATKGSPLPGREIRFSIGLNGSVPVIK